MNRSGARGSSYCSPVHVVYLQQMQKKKKKKKKPICSTVRRAENVLFTSTRAVVESGKLFSLMLESLRSRNKFAFFVEFFREGKPASKVPYCTNTLYAILARLPNIVLGTR